VVGSDVVVDPVPAVVVVVPDPLVVVVEPETTLVVVLEPELAAVDGELVGDVVVGAVHVDDGVVPVVDAVVVGHVVVVVDDGSPVVVVVVDDGSPVVVDVVDELGAVVDVVDSSDSVASATSVVDVVESPAVVDVVESPAVVDVVEPPVVVEVVESPVVVEVVELEQLVPGWAASSLSSCATFSPPLTMAGVAGAAPKAEMSFCPWVPRANRMSWASATALSEVRPFVGTTR
jgi:hypothetical protein